MNDFTKTLSLTTEIINSSVNVSDDVYCDFVSKIAKNFKYLKNISIGIFFVQNTDYILKSAINNNEIIANYKISNLNYEELYNSKDNYIVINTKTDDLLYKNTILVKLAIRDSIFGFALLSTDSIIDNYVISSFEALVNVISYKIKDYELNEVFKIQLRAMQDAVIEKEHAYAIIKRQHKKLEELDKTKNLFLANISHELRTPLNAIIGFSQALDSKIFGELNEKQAEYIKDIQISSLHLLGMINEILDISKLQAHAMKFNPSNVNINQLIQESINILSPLYENKNISVKFNSKYNGEIFADHQKFQQILFNLLSNAIKFTDKNGKIEINSYVEDNNYYLSVADNGIGIEKKNHNKIFKKFVHLNSEKNQNSTGLGLTITKELVKLHKGKISLESEINKGATFKMEFKNILI